MPWLVDEALAEAPKVFQVVFIISFVGTVTAVLVAPLYKVLVTEPLALVQLFALNVTVTSFLQL